MVPTLSLESLRAALFVAARRGRLLDVGLLIAVLLASALWLADVQSSVRTVVTTVSLCLAPGWGLSRALGARMSVLNLLVSFATSCALLMVVGVLLITSLGWDWAAGVIVLNLLAVFSLALVIARGSALANEPHTVEARAVAAPFEEGRRPESMNREVAREVETRVTARVPESSSAVDRSAVGAPEQLRLPVSPRVAQGAPLVRVSTARYRHDIGVAAARTRLAGLHHEDDLSFRRAAVSRWVVRTVALLLVPSVLTYEVLTGTSWLGRVRDDIGGQYVLLVALALTLVGSVWTFAVTRPSGVLRSGPLTKGESHAVRSLLAAEQLALRLAAGATPSDAWLAAALTNHFPAGSAIPAADVDDALLLVEQLSRVARRRQMNSVRRHIAAVILPMLTCLLPATVLILLL
jgi:hypothetical protein